MTDMDRQVSAAPQRVCSVHADLRLSVQGIIQQAAALSYIRTYTSRNTLSRRSCHVAFGPCKQGCAAYILSLLNSQSLWLSGAKVPASRKIQDIPQKFLVPGFTTADDVAANDNRSTTSSTASLQTCGKCRLAKYCSRECQAADWGPAGQHKKLCKHLDMISKLHQWVQRPFNEWQLW